MPNDTMVEDRPDTGEEDGVEVPAEEGNDAGGDVGNGEDDSDE